MKHKIEKKLKLNRHTIACLNEKALGVLFGGEPVSCEDGCVRAPNTLYPECITYNITFCNTCSCYPCGNTGNITECPECGEPTAQLHGCQ